MSREGSERTIYDDTDSWAGIPEWAFSHPEMTPRAFQVFAFLILKSDKFTGLTYNMKRETIAKGIGLQGKTNPETANCHPIDAAIKVLVKIGCVKVIKSKHKALDANGVQKIAKNGKPAVYWGPSQYLVVLTEPRGSHENVPTPLVTKSSPGWSQKSDQGSHENVLNIQEPSYKSFLTNNSYANSLSEHLPRREINTSSTSKADEAWLSIREEIMDICELNYESLTASEKGKINSATSELREVDATPQEIQTFAGWWQDTYPTATMTPKAITGHWSQSKHDVQQLAKLDAVLSDGFTSSGTPETSKPSYTYREHSDFGSMRYWIDKEEFWSDEDYQRAKDADDPFLEPSPYAKAPY